MFEEKNNMQNIKVIQNVKSVGPIYNSSLEIFFLTLDKFETSENENLLILMINKLC